MERGLIVEADAVDWQAFDRDVTAQRVGFITDDDHTMGCSPDRLVGDEGLLEIEAPLTYTQVEYWISGEVSERFRPQLQGQLYISQRSWVDIVCWHDVLPKLVRLVEPDEQFITALARELQIFNFFIERVMEKIRATYEVPVPQGSLALKAAFRASLETRPLSKEAGFLIAWDRN
jgi:YqaJ-like viral recombinase domain